MSAYCSWPGRRDCGVWRGAFKKLIENLPDLVVLVEPLLVVRRVLGEQLDSLHRRRLAVVRDDDVCRRLMTVPGFRQGSSTDLSRPPALLFPSWILLWHYHIAILL